jgi:glycosyltransferase involved in cell wall biosynthesis
LSELEAEPTIRSNVPQLSVIICTHNPRAHYLSRVLGGLQAQTLPPDQWELLLIDNASKEPLARVWDLSWHPQGRHVREDEVGLTAARLRSIQECRGQILVFLDDDNIASADYLAEVVALFRDWPMLGAIGASIRGEFEVPPAEWMGPYLPGLAVCELDQDHWSNTHHWSLATPYGAGLSVRHHVAEYYADKVLNQPFRKLLGRSGTGLGAGEDIDLALCAVDLGLGMGRFKRLKLIHLIPKARLTMDYIVNLNAGFATANELLAAIRQNGQGARVSFLKGRLRFLFDWVRARGIQRRVLWAMDKARRRTKGLIAARGLN